VSYCHNSFLYVVEVFKPDGTPAGQGTVRIDWGPAREWVRFQAERRGRLLFNGALPQPEVAPIWDRKRGEPYIEGFRIQFPGNGAGALGGDFTTAYFRKAALLVSSKLVERGQLEAGDQFLYRVTAYEGREVDPPGTSALEVSEEPPEFTLAEASLEQYRRRALPEGILEPDEMAVFFQRRVLEEARAFTLAEQGRETGGVLIGHLLQDSSVPDVFAEITAQIPAEHTRGDAVKLTFTAETWTAVTSAIRLRRRSEVYLGYWHSHPVREWCKSRECSLEKQRNCRLARDFFSEDDQALLRAVFPRAYSLGLVVNDVAFSEPTFSLFGWHRGGIESRGYFVLEEERSNAKSG